MAGRSAVLTIKILSDAKNAIQGAADTQTGYEKFAGGISKAAPIAAGALAAIGAAGFSAAKAAGEDAKSADLLATSLRNATGATHAQLAANEKWITKTSIAAAVADDQLRPALATLARATGDVGTSQNALNLALDISAATGKDLGSVSDALSKGYAGNTTSLGRLVPGLDKAILATGDMDKISAELERTTGGSAEAAANSAGNTDRMTIAFGEAQESLGAALLPALTTLASMLVTVATWVQDNTTAVLTIVGVLAGFAAAILVVDGALKAWRATQAVIGAGKAVYTTLTTSVGRLRDGYTSASAASSAFSGKAGTLGGALRSAVDATRAGITTAGRWVAAQTASAAAAVRNTAVSFAQRTATIASTAAAKAAAAAQWLWNAALSANPVGLIIIAVLAFVAAIVLLWKNCEGFRDVVLGIWEGIKTAAEVAWNAIKAAVDVVITAVTIYVRTYLAIVTAVWTGIRTAAETAWTAIKTAIRVVADWIGTRVEEVKTVATGVWTTIQTTAETAWTNLKTAIKTALTPVETAISAVQTAFDNVLKVVKSIIDWVGRIKVPSISLPWASSAPAVPAPAASSPSFARAVGGARAVAALRATQTGPSITVTGALDPVAVARQIRAILTADERRRGGVRIAGVA